MLMNLSLAKTAFLLLSYVSLIQSLTSCSSQTADSKEVATDSSGVAILLVDADHPLSVVNENIYGHFLEHINHSVEDGLYAEQVQGQGFEGKDFETHWKSIDKNGSVTLIDTAFQKGIKSIRLSPNNGTAGISQQRFYAQKNVAYNGSLWIKPEAGTPKITLLITDTVDNEIANASIAYSGTEWQEVKFSFTPTKTDTMGVVKIVAQGAGAVLIDFISIMTADARANGMFRPDLLESLKALKAPFIRWPGHSHSLTDRPTVCEYTDCRSVKSRSRA